MKVAKIINKIPHVVRKGPSAMTGSYPCYGDNHFWIYSGDFIPEGMSCQCGLVKYKSEICKECGQKIVSEV